MIVLVVLEQFLYQEQVVQRLDQFMRELIDSYQDQELKILFLVFNQEILLEPLITISE